MRVPSGRHSRQRSGVGRINLARIVGREGSAASSVFRAGLLDGIHVLQERPRDHLHCGHSCSVRGPLPDLDTADSSDRCSGDPGRGCSLVDGLQLT